LRVSLNMRTGSSEMHGQLEAYRVRIVCTPPSTIQRQGQLTIPRDTRELTCSHSPRSLGGCARV
jgi:hypothetical protein